MKDFFPHTKGLDVLARYAKISPYLKNFLWKKEIASKIVGENFVVLKRGAKATPLYIKDFEAINDKFLQLRSWHHLSDVKKQLSEKQVTLRKYFVPRKLVNFFYATNNEYWTKIDRIFIDIDRQEMTSEQAQKVAYVLIKIIQKDKKLSDLIDLPTGQAGFRLLTLWTGSSFHIYLMLANPINHKTYDQYFSYGDKKSDSFVSKRAQAISQETDIQVNAAHARKKNIIILDTSNTPPGKLARVPFSFHIKNAKTIDGISVPLAPEDLQDKKLISKLTSLNTQTVRKNIKKYNKILQDAMRQI